MERFKRPTTDEMEPIVYEPRLTRVDQQEIVYIDKNEFTIGRAKDNNEVILDLSVSRKHCVFKCEGQDEWTVTNLSSFPGSTLVNGAAVQTREKRQVVPGDIVQFGLNETYKYVFSFAKKGHCAKKPRLDEKLFDSMLIKQKTFAESQNCQRKELEDKLETKHMEQVWLRQQLQELLSQQTAAKDDKENLMREIATLKSRIQAGNEQELNLHSAYSELTAKLENERQQFELRINVEKRKWQEQLDMSKQEKETLETKMREQTEKWREQQQEQQRWRAIMEGKVNEEKNVQTRLLNEKNALEERLKETERVLKEQEAKAETSQAILNASVITEPVGGSSDCIFFEVTGSQTSQQEYRIIDSIDLTDFSQSIEMNTKEGVFEKVSGIMDEQLTCSICSELFIKATTLNCTHTFCHHCINLWCRKRRECPVCRKPVVSMNQSLVLDNFIESMIENLPVEQQSKRKELLLERKASMITEPISSSSGKCIFEGSQPHQEYRVIDTIDLTGLN